MDYNAVMSRERSSVVTWMPGGVAVLAVLLAAYVSGYFLLSNFSVHVDADFPADSNWAIRSFPNDGLVSLYLPLARIESWIRGIDLLLYAEDKKVV